MSLADRLAVAERVRRLLAGLDSGDLGVIANRLGVDELALRMTIDDTVPHPVVDVLAAVVAHLGVDPSWLIKGEYDLATHRRVEEDDPDAMPNTLRQVAQDASIELTNSWPVGRTP